MESHTCDNKKPRKRQQFQRGHSMTLAAAGIISKIEYFTWELMLYRVTREHTRLKDK
jgi:hypothetical protein